MIQRTIEFLVRRRLMAVSICALAIAVLGAFAARLQVDNSLSVWFIEDDPALVAYERFMDEFGNDEVVVTAIHSDVDAFDEARLDRLWSLSRKIAGITGVAQVRSLASIETVQGSAFGPVVVPVIDPPVTDKDIETAHRLLSAGNLASSLIGKDAKTLVIYSRLEVTPNIDKERGRVIDEIRDATAAALAPGETASHAGVGVLHEAINAATYTEGVRFVGLSYLVIIVALYLITRRMAWTLLAILSVTLADIALLGTMAATGHSINMITVALLPLVMILGVANVVHIAAEIDDCLAHNRRGRHDLMQRLQEILGPSLFNMATTAVGMLSLSTASMAVTRDYGIFGALGVVLAFVFSVVGAAALLPRATRFRPAPNAGRRIGSIVERVVLFSIRHRAGVLFTGIFLFIAAIFGIARITVDTESISYLPADDPARVATYRIEDTVGPFFPLEITVHTDSAGAWSRAGFIAALSNAQTALEQNPSIGRTSSAGDVLRDVHVAVTGEQLERHWVPEEDEDVQNIVDLLARSRREEVLDHWVSDDERTLRLTATMPMASARSFMELSEEARATTARAFGETADVSLGGYLPLYSRIVANTLRDQVNSSVVAFVVVFLMIALLLRSWRYAAAAIPSNLLAVMLMLALMGVARMKLDLATVTVEAVILGVIVDDTVHILHRMRRQLDEGCTFEEAMRRVARHSGVAVVSICLIFCAGFLVISLAGSAAVSHPGLLMAVAVVLALAGNLMLLPACASFLFQRRAAMEPAAAVAHVHEGAAR